MQHKYNLEIKVPYIIPLFKFLNFSGSTLNFYNAWNLHQKQNLRTNNKILIVSMNFQEVTINICSLSALWRTVKNVWKHKEKLHLNTMYHHGIHCWPEQILNDKMKMTCVEYMKNVKNFDVYWLWKKYFQNYIMKRKVSNNIILQILYSMEKQKCLNLSHEP